MLREVKWFAGSHTARNPVHQHSVLSTEINLLTTRLRTSSEAKEIISIYCQMCPKGWAGPLKVSAVQSAIQIWGDLWVVNCILLSHIAPTQDPTPAWGLCLSLFGSPAQGSPCEARHWSAHLNLSCSVKSEKLELIQLHCIINVAEITLLLNARGAFQLPVLE